MLSRKKLIYISGIEVIGNARYIQQVRRSLMRLKKKDPASFKLILKYIGRIEWSERSGMAPWQSPPTFYLADLTAFPSVTWCASCILHDAHHSKLYLDYLRRNKKTPGRRIYSGRLVELFCIRKQLISAKRIGASASEIAHLKRLDGKHIFIRKQYW